MHVLEKLPRYLPLTLELVPFPRGSTSTPAEVSDMTETHHSQCHSALGLCHQRLRAKGGNNLAGGQAAAPAYDVTVHLGNPGSRW